NSPDSRATVIYIAFEGVGSALTCRRNRLHPNDKAILGLACRGADRQDWLGLRENIAAQDLQCHRRAQQLGESLAQRGTLLRRRPDVLVAHAAAAPFPSLVLCQPGREILRKRGGAIERRDVAPHAFGVVASVEVQSPFEGIGHPFSSEYVRRDAAR